MPALPSQQVFVSYSHHDALWRDQLFTAHLSSTFGDCQVWTDAQLRAGERWQQAIDERLADCTVAVCLVSERFLDSRFIAERELPAILQRAQAGTLRLVWIPIAIDRPMLESRCPALAALQGAVGFDDTLAAQPTACAPALLDQVRQHIREQMRAAIDPRGTALARLVSRRYEVERWLGEGNLAAVYKARDRVLQRDVAIKVLKDAQQRQSFMTDVRDAIRTSEEPNFINIYHAATDEDGEPFILPLGRRRDVARQRLALRALAARLQAAELEGQAPAASDLEDLGYLVPDHFGGQLETAEAVRADQYMLGVLAWEMCIGQRPRPVPAPYASQRYPQLKDVLQERDLQDDLSLVIARDSLRRCALAPGIRYLKSRARTPAARLQSQAVSSPRRSMKATTSARPLRVFRLVIT